MDNMFVLRRSIRPSGDNFWIGKPSPILVTEGLRVIRPEQALFGSDLSASTPLVLRPCRKGPLLD